MSIDPHTRAIFDRRALELSAPPAGDGSRGAIEALVFMLGTEQYAFPTSEVREVRPLPKLTRLAGTPAYIAGLINVRGKIVPVLNLRSLFGAGGRDEPAQGNDSVVLLSHPRGDVGVLISGRPRVRGFNRTDLTDIPAGLSAGLDPAYVRGVTTDSVIVLHAEGLLAHPLLVVTDQDVS